MSRLPADALTAGVSGDGELDRAIAGFAASVVRQKGVDPLTTELVRLRCAQIHDCRLCGSLRNAEALAEGFDEDMQAKISRYEQSDLAPHQIAALRLCDAMILTPSLADATLKANLREHFSPAQIAELMFDVMKWSQQKALVALRMEAPPWQEINVLTFDQQGQPGFEGPAYTEEA
ncbi:hypothetical protein A3709_01835 [Halioglobus sp. HI00S01]|uniref:carboxymuconolactone decarboxylase family protein n=1 Tax=Halioglobus sp. HI00S01 TaxID=1822214 RepID=UPI0007C26093|nr:carboxymuconolactone decarboxylase family protein [Halioglobus sp. HI00S01]KZX58230.1 hypothetical protein A3709_01835 [Halioglobus sp. HI00S01]